MFRISMLIGGLAILMGCTTNAADKVAEAPQARFAATDAVGWKRVQQQKLTLALQGTPYILSEFEDGWLIKIDARGTFHPQRPGLLLPAALAPIGQVTRHLADDPDVAVLILGMPGEAHKLLSSQQIGSERARSVASIFRLNKLPGHRLRLHGMLAAPVSNRDLGIALLILPAQTLHAKAALYQDNAMALLSVK